jgi:hypothetical protein
VVDLIVTISENSWERKSFHPAPAAGLQTERENGGATPKLGVQLPPLDG